MPLKPGSDKRTVSTNISEFHTGKTYAHTKAKFGKKKADAQAVAVALSTARKYAKKADGGGDLSADDMAAKARDQLANQNERIPPPPDWMAKEAEANFAALTPAERTSIQTERAPTPPAQSRDWAKGLSRWWYGDQPSTPGSEVSLTEDPISKMGKGFIDWASGPGKALNEGMTPEEQAEWGAQGALNMVGTGLVRPVRGGLGTAGGFTTKGAEKASEIHQAVMEASMYGDKHYNPEALAKDLKSFYPKDIANSAFYLGISPEDLVNLKGFMSKGASEAFDKHYLKLIKSPTVNKAAIELPPDKFNEWLDKNPNEDPFKQIPFRPETEDLMAKEAEHFGEEAPVGPEGWNAHEDYESSPTSGVVHENTKMPFHEAFNEAVHDKYFDAKGGPWKDVKTYGKPQVDLLKAMEPGTNPYSYGDVVSILSKKPFEESGISPQGIWGTNVQKYLGQFDSKALTSAMADFHLTDTQMKNILSYLPRNMVEEMKGIIGKELMEYGHNVTEEKLSPEAKKAMATDKAIEEGLKEVHWPSYKPPRVQKPEALPLKEDPNKLRSMGFNVDFPLYKGGNLAPEQIASKNDIGAYPAELMDPQTAKHNEKALFLADEPHVAQQYGKVSKYIARPAKAVEVDWAKVAKQTGYNADAYESGEVHYSGWLMNKIISAARKQKADVVIMHNMWDLGGPQTQYAFLNTHPLRAPHANFDPAKLHLRYPLAGLVGGGILGYGALGSNESEAGQMKDGGKVKHPQIDENPQEHEFINFARGGLIDSHIPGRTDKIPMKVATGAYILPADIPSALGQGNSKAGAEILKKMFTHSAYGLPPPHVHSTAHPPHLHFGKHARGGKVEAEKALPPDHQLGMKVPKGGSMCANCRFLSGPRSCGNEAFEAWNGGEQLPEPANQYCCDLYQPKAAKKADGGEADHVPIVAAGGEYVIHPDVVKHIGGGDMKSGHKVLDSFVINTRKQHIKTLKGLKPPK